LNAHNEFTEEGSLPSVSWPKKWLRLLLAGNPFFIASAALLLFGINRLAVDPNFLRVEETKLLFNFSALQLYEVVLIGVAAFLAARAFLYDSTLLVMIESIVLLVPFMLVTQAALIDRRLALGLCAFGSGLVLIRFTALKNWFSELNLPGRSFFLLGFLVLLNGSTPLLLRHYVEGGGSDAWEEPNQLGWLIVLPIALLLGLTIRSRDAGTSAKAGQAAWIPLLLYALWIIGTAVHLWCMGYVAEREFHLYLLAPLLWAASWTAYAHAGLFSSRALPYLKPTLASASVAAILLAATAADARIGFVLAALNVLVFGVLVKSRREAQPLLLLSVSMAIALLPLEWLPGWMPSLSRMKCIELGLGASILALSLQSPRPMLTLCGSFTAALYPRILWPALSGHVSLEVGLIFLLLQSLRWEDSRWEKLRIVTAATWIVHAFGWTYVGETLSGWTVSSAAVIVLLAYPFLLYLTDALKSRLIPVTAIVVLSAKPLTVFAHWIQPVSTGLVALLLSFALLGAGTWFALYRNRLLGGTELRGTPGL